MVGEKIISKVSLALHKNKGLLFACPATGNTESGSNKYSGRSRSTLKVGPTQSPPWVLLKTVNLEPVGFSYHHSGDNTEKTKYVESLNNNDPCEICHPLHEQRRGG